MKNTLARKRIKYTPSRSKLRWIGGLCLSIPMAFLVVQPAFGDGRYPASDTTEVLATLSLFRTALADGDSAAVAALLDAEVRISEGGTIETKREYLSGHFHGDSSFLGSLTREEISRMVHLEEDIAWVISKTRLFGSFRDRQVDSNSLETAILKKEDGNWKIFALHWSSGRRN